MEIRPVAFDIDVPAGVAGPDPMKLDVRCFLVPHSDGVSLVDTGLPGSAVAIVAALAELGATWSDVSDVLLSHDHPDHVGSLAEITVLAPTASVWGNAPLTTRPLVDGETVRGLRVVATPGHTDGHVSFLHGEGTLLVGDSLGNREGRLQRAPGAFTSDPDRAEESIRTIYSLGAQRMLFAHGPELADPLQALAALLER
jgi:glyoxylase-like metal-dependent hydrolase (beta-lactamase superfamily II)